MFYRAKAERSCKVWILILELKNLGSIFQFPKQFVYLKLFGSSHDEKKRFIMKLFKVSSRWFTIRWDSKINLFTSYLLVLLHFHRWSLAHVADFRTGMPSAENPSQGLLRVSGCLRHLDVIIFFCLILFSTGLVVRETSPPLSLITGFISLPRFFCFCSTEIFVFDPRKQKNENFNSGF